MSVLDVDSSGHHLLSKLALLTRLMVQKNLTILRRKMVSLLSSSGHHLLSKLALLTRLMVQKNLTTQRVYGVLGDHLTLQLPASDY